MTLVTSFGRMPRAVGRRLGDALFDLRPRMRRASGKTVVVHPGFRKTGTTTIQTMLRENEALLAEHVGVVMRWSTPSSEAMHKAGQRLAAAPGPATARAFRRAARSMSAAIRALPQPVVILTDENIIGRRIVAGDRDVFDMAAAALAIVEEEFAAHELRIVLTTRERSGWLRSCYNQDVKRHKFCGDLDAWLTAHEGCRDWEQGAPVLAAALSAPVRFLQMEDDLAEGRFLGRAILETAGLTEAVLDRVAPPSRQNPSLDAVQLELIREFNALDLPYGVTGRIVDVVRRRRDLLRHPDDRAP
jgi:hypothetical protein